MFARFMPQEGKFFDLFNEHAKLVLEGSQALIEMLRTLREDPDNVAAHCERIDIIEHDADTITHEAMRQLHKSFITPLDRDQIHELVTNMDDILDIIQDLSHTVNLYDVKHLTEEVFTLGNICHACCECIHRAVLLLHSMDNASAILKICQEVDVLESAADREMRTAMSRLFREEPDVRELIKLKAVYELLEVITDRCEDVANTLEGIVLENS